MVRWYLRVLKMPTIDKSSNGTYTVSTVVRITNDLGDESCPEGIPFNMTLTVGSRTYSSEFCTLPGQFSIKCSETARVGLKQSQSPVQISINALLPGVSSVETLPFMFHSGAPPFTLRAITPTLKSVEQLGGESIARHVWDAGVCVAEQIYECRLPLPSALDTVLELGAGCGIAGLQLARTYPVKRLILTDLEDAKELCIQNIKQNNIPVAEFREFDWNCPPKDLPQADLVLVADCTYNPDSYMALMQTLKQVVTKVGVLAHKHRHDAERQFFDMLKAQFATIELVVNEIHITYFAKNPAHLQFVQLAKRKSWNASES